MLGAISRAEFRVPTLHDRPNGFRHACPIAGLHRPPESGRDLQKVRDSLLVRDIDTGLVERGWIEEHGVSLVQLELNHPGLDVVDVSVVSDRDIAFLEQLRVRHESSRTGRQGHVGVGDCALQSQELGCRVGNKGESADSIKRLVADVCVSVWKMLAMRVTHDSPYVCLAGCLLRKSRW